MRIQQALTRFGTPAPRDRLFVLNLSKRYRWYVGPARAVLLLLSGYLFFRRREPYFADII